MSNISIDAVYNFYHDNHKDGEYNVKYNGTSLGKVYIRFHYSSSKWNIVLSNVSADIDETNFDTNGRINYNKSRNVLEINQYNTFVEIYP